MHTQGKIRSFKQYSALFALGVFLVILSGCASPAEPVAELPAPLVNQAAYTPTPTITAVPTATVVPTATASPRITLTPTPEPYRDLYIQSLVDRKYGGGVLEDAGSLNGAVGLTRKLFKYRSEGHNLYGFINIPDGSGPFPVIVMAHGYVNPAEFSTLDYSVRYADALVAAGYIAIHPNLRGYGPSENGENILGIGDTIDVLNLIALVRQQAGSDGLLKTADSSRIGLWGHSMGGGIVMRALIVDQDIRAGLLYASVNADETINLSHFEKDGRGNTKIDAPRGILNLLSPKDYLDRIAAPLSIHHGGEDEVVPISWSRNLCAALEAMGKSVECREYPDQPHTFKNDGDGQFIRAMVEFYDQHLR